MNNRNLTILAAVLGVLFLAALIWGFTRNSAATQLQEDNTLMTAEVSQLEILRDRLTQQVDSLGTAYDAATADNEQLRGELSEAQETAKRALYDMRRAQRSRKNDNDVAYQMRQQIEDLINVRTLLETSVKELTEENETLRSRNVQLNRDLSTAKTEAYNATKEKDNLARLNQTLEKDLEVMTLGAFKATAIQADLYQGRRGTKTTTNASRVRRMNVSFDLADVPEEYLGVRPIYLMMTDQSGTPVTSENPVNAKVTINGAKTNIIALEGRDVNVERSQRLSFTHELDEKLSEGFYRIQIVTDLGILGSTNLQLR